MSTRTRVIALGRLAAIWSVAMLSPGVSGGVAAETIWPPRGCVDRPMIGTDSSPGILECEGLKVLYDIGQAAGNACRRSGRALKMQFAARPQELVIICADVAGTPSSQVLSVHLPGRQTNFTGTIKDASEALRFLEIISDLVSSLQPSTVR